jgi:hypothetical protein
VERRIQAAMLDPEKIIRFGSDHLSNSMSVLRPPLKCSQNQKIECPL